jgi:hypothetical protein
MTQFLCKIIGHREYDRKVLDMRPWEYEDLRQYPQSAFREHHCLRCQAELNN